MLSEQNDSSLMEKVKRGFAKAIPIVRFICWSLAILLMIAALLNWTALVALLALAALTGLIWFVVKFRRDNENITPEGCSKVRFLVSALFGLVRFIPGLLILLVGFGIVFAVDQVVNWGLDRVSVWAESNELIIIKNVKIVDRHPLSAWRIFGIDQKSVIEDVEVPERLSAATKWFVRTVINFSKLVLYYPWVFLSFFALQCYFYFWSRAFVAGGGRVTMQFPKYLS